jgi:GNAT superfamily N-acetyltransferase
VSDLQIHVSTPVMSEALKAEVALCWMEVANAGGAVGFPFPPVELALVSSAVETLAAEVFHGDVILFQARQNATLVGWVVLRFNQSPLTAHWATVERLQSHPDHRAAGIGSALLTAAVDHARALGLESLHLALRGGEQLEPFYEKHGWKEVGRHPNALRLSQDDHRDEVFMAIVLHVRS